MNTQILETAREFKPNTITEAVNIDLKLNETKIRLGIGLYVLPAIKQEPEIHSEYIYGNKFEKNVNLKIFNNLPSPIVGNLLIVSESPFIKDFNQKIELSSQEGGTVSVPVQSINETGIIKFYTQVNYNFNGTDHKTEITHQKIPILDENSLFALTDEKNGLITVYTGYRVFKILLQGGILYGEDETDLNQFQTVDEGLSVKFNEFRRINFSYEINQYQNSLTVFLKGLSEEKPGIILNKTIKFFLNSPVITTCFSIENQSIQTYTLNLTIGHNPKFNLHNLRHVLPYKSEIIQTTSLNAPRSPLDFATNPEMYHESWIALESDDDLIRGLIWSTKESESPTELLLQLANFRFNLKIAPGQTSRVCPVWICFSEPGNWKNIRRKWDERTHKTRNAENRSIKTRGIFNIEDLKIERIDSKNYSVSGLLTTVIEQNYDGLLQLKCPIATIQSPEKDFVCLRDAPFEFNYNLTFSNKPVLKEFQFEFVLITQFGSATLHKVASFVDEERPLESQIDNISLEGYNGLKWSSNLFESIIMPKYLAGFISFKLANQYEIVKSSFPTIKSELYNQNETGGIRFRFGKNFESLINGEDLTKFIVRSAITENSENIQFTLENPIKKSALPKIDPIFTIRWNKEEPLVIHYNAKIRNTSEISQKILVALQWFPKMSTDLQLHITKYKEIQNLPVYKAQNRLIIINKDNNPFSITNIKEHWKIAMIGPQDYEQTIVMLDLRPVVLYTFQVVENVIQPNSTIDLEWQMKITL